MYNMILFVTFLNAVLILKSIYFKNFYFFIFYSIWMVLYTFQIYFIYNDLQLSTEVHYLHVDINLMGFNIALVLYTIFMFMNFLIPQKLTLNIQRVIIKIPNRNIKVGKFIYIILIVLLIILLINKVGGFNSLLTLSRPGFISGVPLILFLIMSTKVYFLMNYINNKKIDKFLLLIFIFTLFVFAISSRLMLLTSILFILLSLWSYALKENNINKFNKYIYYTAIPPFLFLFLGILKWGNNSINTILNDGFINYFSDKFSDIYTFLIVNIYKLSIESFSILAAFLSENGLNFKPNFMISDLNFFTYILPSFLKKIFSDYILFIDSFSSVGGAVPVTIATLTESFNVLGIVVFTILIFLLSKVVKRVFTTNNIYTYIIGLIVLSNSFLLIRGNIKVFLLYTIIDLFGLLLYYFLNKLVIRR